ncbi:hypothetical protein [Streptococcus dentapri]|uniref:Uncharacterized protein n=1 Tax=Streptococcus dentapri TaxID=573564 RepID=A0ABV8CZT2_9STRE
MTQNWNTETVLIMAVKTETMKRLLSYKLVRLVLALLLLTFLAFSGVFLFKQYVRIFDPKFAWRFEEKPENIKSVQLYDQNKELVLVEPKKINKSSNAQISQDHLMETSRKTRTDRNANEYKIDPGEHFYVYLYDLNDPQLKSEKLDVIGVLKKYHIKDAVVRTTLRTYKGHDYIEILLGKQRGHYDNADLYSKYYRIDTGKLVSESKAEVAEKTIPSPTGLWDKTEKFNLSLSGYSINDDYGKAKGLSGLNIAKEAPELTAAFNRGAALYRRPEMMSDATWYDTIMHWFAPQGQDVVELYETDYSTGEKTQIKSYEEYMQWRKDHPRT